MGRKKIIAGNWKMNKTKEEAIALVSEVINSASSGESVKIFFPPFPLIPYVSSIVNEKPGFYFGAQNISEHESGAYTGEVSGAMLASIGCKFVLVGHSERRQYFNEYGGLLTKKINQAFKNNLSPVYCVGELLNERKSNQQFEVVKKQLIEVLSGLETNQINNTVIAYEPVWAIGTGETATPDQAQEMHAFIRKCIAELYDKKTASDISILYGGSCNAQNATELFSCADIDGGLIGGASLKSADFCKIIASML